MTHPVTAISYFILAGLWFVVFSHFMFGMVLTTLLDEIKQSDSRVRKHNVELARWLWHLISFSWFLLAAGDGAAILYSVGFHRIG